MATAAAKIGPAPRYGSPAEVAALLGLSTKTIRRMIAADSVPSYRVGRRVLVPYRDADRVVRRNRNRRAPTMAVAPPTEPPLIDPATGRLRPLSDEERRARSARLLRTLEEIAKITDETDTDENWAEVFRGLDAARPEYPPAEGDI
jgi:excisionase family DNA binding protein